MPLTRQQKKDLNITDLDVYTMASEEATDVKFEAFENRMEEKMRSLFAEFSIGRLLLPSTLREMIFNGLIGLSTPMEDSLGSNSRKDY
ncbi:hypothetical protein GW17_00011492 [Ensete ventricosum]|nr:hypothetical protein GW17_00011492 [Ensete ventricosum]